MDNEINNTYIIPPNFEEAGGVFGGMFKLRNVIEAIIIGLILFKGGSIALSFFDLTIRIILFVIILLPVIMISLIGINDESLTEYIQSVYFFKKRRRKLSYRLPQTEIKEEGQEKRRLGRIF